MFHTLSSRDLSRFPELADQMFLLRHRQFHDRRNWRVSSKDGRERDMFDDLDPLYALLENPAGHLLASARLLPTTGPHMLSEVFPDVMGGRDIIRHPLIWESSRFCVDPRAAKKEADGIGHATRALLHGMLSTARDAGILHIISVYDLMMERVLRRAGCRFERIGEVIEMDAGLRTTAGLFEVSAMAIAQVAPGREPR